VKSIDSSPVCQIQGYCVREDHERRRSSLLRGTKTDIDLFIRPNERSQTSIFSSGLIDRCGETPRNCVSDFRPHRIAPWSGVEKADRWRRTIPPSCLFHSTEERR
jgi:hypothetical protein